MKRLHKIFTIFLSVILLCLVTTTAIVASAAENTVVTATGDAMELNFDACGTNFTWQIDDTGKLTPTIQELQKTKEYAYFRYFEVAKSERPSNTVYSADVSELVETLKEAMMQRKNDVVLYYQIPVSDFDGSEDALRTVSDGMVNAALAHTSKPTEGDYLRWDLGGYSLIATVAYDSDYYYLDLKYGITYYTTAEQQQELDGAVEALLAQFAFSSQASDYDKICAIYDYICDNVLYDYENLNNSEHVLKYTAYAALINKSSVCQGYATLLYRLLLECGIDCRVIVGTSHNESHAWNIVQLNGTYYNLDATWDAQGDSYGYFLKCEAGFEDHTRKAEYTSEAFYQVYPIAKTDYLISTDTWIDFAATSFSGGNGTQASPYVISSAEELALLAKHVNLEDSRYNHAYYILGSDIDLVGHNWMPIGVVKGNGLGGTIDCRGFFGVLDGNGHTISNMQILKAYGSIYQYGLFGMVMGTVKNLILSDAVIDFECVDKGWQSSNGMGSSVDVGGLCGYLTEHGTIQNCRVTDISVNVKVAMSLTCGGGIGVANYANVDQLIVSGKVSGIAGRAIWIGGCISSVGNETTVTASGFTGKVSAESDGAIVDIDPGDSGYSYLHYVGGFCGSAGRANSDIVMRDCYAYADVYSVYRKGSQDVGGFAGAIGTLHGKAIYENLVFKGQIIANRNGVSKQETSFWQGECGFGAQDGGLLDKVSEWSYKNCIVIIDDVITVTDRNENLYQTNDYRTKDYTLEDLFGNVLEFDSGLWHLDFNHNYILKHAHLNDNVSHKEVFEKAVAPSCEGNGLSQGKRCSVCNEVLVAQETVASLGHTFGDWYEANAPTCTETGTDERECSVCHHKETRTTDAKGHTEVVDAALAPSCTETGLTEGKHCSVCNEVLVAQETVASLGHTFGDWYEIKAPTCTATGTDERECSVCHNKETRATDALGHTNAAAVVENKVDATCTADGSYDSVVYCAVCDAELSREVKTIEKLGHDYNTTWSTDASSHWHECSKCGDKKDNASHTAGAAATESTAQICTVCGYVITPALGHTHNFNSSKNDETNHWKECACGEKTEVSQHTWNDGEITKEATVDEEGVKTYTCTVCGHTKDESIAKLPTRTDGIDTTNKPVESETLENNDIAEKKSGCAGAIGGASVGVITLISVGGALLLKKKKRK